MIRKFVLFISISIFSLSYSQQEILDKYPYGQFFYIGGENALQKEMVQIVKDKGLLPCPKTDETYKMKILVNSDSSINYVKDFDSLSIVKNKCAFEFGRKVISNLKHWMPAKYNEKFVEAIAEIKITPFFLYYSKNDPKMNVYKEPEFKKGMDSFSKEVMEVFQNAIKRNEDKYITLNFVINESGFMEDITIEGDFTDIEKKRLTSSLKRIKEWNPGKFNAIPIRKKMRLPIIQHFDVRIENEYLNTPMNRYESFRSR